MNSDSCIVIPPSGCHNGGVTTPESRETPTRSWTLLTNHGRVLLLIASNPDSRLRDLATEAGITERAAGSIVSDLQEAGYLTVNREGRRNSYVVHADQPFRHPAEAGHDVGELLRVFT